MNEMTTIIELFKYSDTMNRKLIDAARGFSAGQLDQSFEMGMGSLRKTLAHIYVGEMVWLERWKGNVECKWPPYETSETPASIQLQFHKLWSARDAFLATLTAERLQSRQPYRDSAGNLFTALLHEMILQGFVHSAHHRAQAVNMIRHVGGGQVEVDFMYGRRVPA
jgi:uncharacterized damage-inducible protein DinB